MPIFNLLVEVYDDPKRSSGNVQQIYTTEACLQSAVDFAFALEIYEGEKTLSERALLNNKSVLKRDEIKVRPIGVHERVNQPASVRFDMEDDFDKKDEPVINYSARAEGRPVLYSATNHSYVHLPIGDRTKSSFLSPSRLTDAQIKDILRKKANIPEWRIDLSRLEQMVFVI